MRTNKFPELISILSGPSPTGIVAKILLSLISDCWEIELSPITPYWDPELSAELTPRATHGFCKQGWVTPL